MSIIGKSMLFPVFIFANLTIQAQSASVETASLSLRTYNKKGERIDVRIHNLKEAKKHIDQAYQNPVTSNDPKMWLIRARTYLAMQTDTLGEGKKSCLPDNDAIEIAAISIVNCHKTDKSEKYTKTEDAYNAFVFIGANARYLGDLAYNQKDYERSIKYYGLTRSLFPYDDQSLLKRQNISEDGLLFNIATTEKLAGKNEDAKKSLNELIAKNYNDPWVYLELYQIYLEVDHDTAMAIQTIDKGRLVFEDDANLRKQQIFIYSASGRSQELIDIMDKNIELDPYNANNYYLRGVLYSELGNLEKAEADYLKAIENNDEMLLAYEDLGKLYYNKGVAISEEANKLGLNETAKYNKMNEEVKSYFLKAIPNFERIYELSTDPKQKNQFAQVLLSMYLKTEQTEKYTTLKKELE